MTITNFIGDIHGHASELRQLLTKLGYQKHKGVFRHPEAAVRTVFVGDYIDRGPEIPEVLDIVRRMVDDGNTIALMGNHEYNAICYNTKDEDGLYLRPHTAKNKHQHMATIKQFEENPAAYADYINWFRSLPLLLETPEYRAVHACWDQEVIDKLRLLLNNDCLTDDLLFSSAKKGTEAFELVEITLKGKELPLPPGISFSDKDGHPRHAVRIKWWIRPQGKTYQDIRMNLEYDVPDVIVDPGHALFNNVYPASAVPVFFGHYWLRDTPNLHQRNICCLDYSVAKGGHLVCYQFRGEFVLDNSNFVFV